LNSPTTISPKARRSSGVGVKKAGSPSFSIVIPTYQRRDVVCGSVRALTELRYRGGIELIVVVDGSTDGTAAALRTMDLPFPLLVVEQPNGGASSARNRGATEARHDVILFLDDDMIAEPDLLEQHARLHREGADAVIGDTPVHPASPDGFLPQSVARWSASTGVKSSLSPFDIFTGQLSVRRAVFEALGGFDAALTSSAAFGNEDADFGVKLLAGYDVRHTPAAISHQLYVVSPRQFMERASLAAAADGRFMRKHPQLAKSLLERKGFSRPLTRLVYRPLARIPLLPELLARSAVRVAELAFRTPFRSSRTIARFFSGARSVAYWSALRAGGWLPASDRPLVLCYHAIEDQSDDPVLAPYGVPPTLFANQLDWLIRHGFSFVTPDQFAAYIGSNAPLPRRPVLLTFDDGYADLIGVARDVLRPRGIEALAFVVTGSKSGTNEWDQAYGAKKINLLSAEERIDLAALGVEIGSHSRTHREMPLLDGPEQLEDAAGSAADLAAQRLPRPRFFAYPFGFSDKGSKDAVRNAGYSASFGCRSDWVERGGDVFDLPRVIILASDRGWRFSTKVRAPRLFANMTWLHQGIRNRLRQLGRRRPWH
jgi:glycosyltransferase involved in cell wall biosynthesis/peptidoglycan/xylan/chitin deacetylase (PgdA/CDA1 family)